MWKLRMQMHKCAQLCIKQKKIYEKCENVLKNLLIDLQRSGLHQIIACVYIDSHAFTNCACRCAFSSKYTYMCTKNIYMKKVENTQKNLLIIIESSSLCQILACMCVQGTVCRKCVCMCAKMQIFLCVLKILA